MSTAKFNTWLNTDGTENFKVRAWVNFNGTGTVAIRAAGNVSSITDNGLGDYTVNFTNALSDANYSVLVTGDNSGSSAFLPFLRTNASVPAVGSIRIGLANSSFSSADVTYANVTVVR
jgi:hypothetical protein